MEGSSSSPDSETAALRFESGDGAEDGRDDGDGLRAADADDGARTGTGGGGEGGDGVLKVWRHEKWSRVTPGHLGSGRPAKRPGTQDVDEFLVLVHLVQDADGRLKQNARLRVAGFAFAVRVFVQSQIHEPRRMQDRLAQLFVAPARRPRATGSRPPGSGKC